MDFPTGLLALLTSLLSLGDAKREKRVIEMAGRALLGAGSSLTALFGEGKRHKGAQRALSNDAIRVGALRRTLYEVTFARARQEALRRVIVAFDPSELNFTFQHGKQGRREIGDGDGRGYEWLNCAVIAPEGGHVLGVAHQALLTDAGPDDLDEVDYGAAHLEGAARRDLEDNFKQQFLTYARLVDTRAPSELELIHVADREFDDGLALRSLLDLPPRNRFVVRANDSRGLQVRRAPWLPAPLRTPSCHVRLPGCHEPDLVDVFLDDLVRALPLAYARDLPLDGRGRVHRGDGPPARTARLAVGALPVRLVRRSKRARRARIDEKPVWLNLVVVREIDPPPGAPLLQWLLLTNLPIDTPEHILFVVDCYVSRWRIEEFFRTTKDALKLERSRLDDPQSTARLLFFVTLKAMFLDALRTEAGLAAGRPVTDEQRRALVAAAARAREIEQAARAGRLPPALSRPQRALLILGRAAKLGRWSPRRGASLGNYVLLRGLHLILHDLQEGNYLWLLQEMENPG